jgi:hypothetical protein
MPKNQMSKINTTTTNTKLSWTSQQYINNKKVIKNMHHNLHMLK